MLAPNSPVSTGSPKLSNVRMKASIRGVALFGRAAEIKLGLLSWRVLGANVN